MPDPVFQTKTIGDGFAVQLKGDTVVAPVEGKVVSIFETKHAICLVDDQENEILIHIGLDTVNLEGKGIELFVKQGDIVEQGQVLAKVSLDLLKENHFSSITPVIFSNMDTERYCVCLKKNGDVTAGEKGILEIKNC